VTSAPATPLLAALGVGAPVAGLASPETFVAQLQALANHRLLPMTPWLAARGLLGQVLPRLAQVEARRHQVPGAHWIAAEESVLAALAASGIDVLVLKGALLVRTVYPEGAVRDRTDTDVLVRRRDWQRVLAVLEAQGYRRSIPVAGAVALDEESWTISLPDGGHHDIDVHHGLISHPALRGVLGFEELWVGARPVPGLAPGLRGPEPMHALLHAALHYHGHQRGQFRPLLWFLDVALLWEAMGADEREAVVAVAIDRGVAAILGVTLAEAARLYAVDVAPAVRTRLDAAGRHEWRAFLATEDHSRLAEFLFALRAEDGWRGRMRYLGELAFPPAAYMRWKYPDDPAPLWRLYLRRAWRGIRRSPR
jgi:hypothetical protein